MPGSEPDRFVAFVDRLAVDLDAIPARAEEMAAAAHLSRFHFERVIAAIAGESPTRFRTRILLERAAYRMTTTDATLLDIAVEAGYSSNEAFTRAFRRDYGVAPSTWRRRPARFRIAAPNDVHFHPPAGLRLPARHRVDSVDLVGRSATASAPDLEVGHPEVEGRLLDAAVDLDQLASDVLAGLRGQVEHAGRDVLRLTDPAQRGLGLELVHHCLLYTSPSPRD